MKPSVYLRSFLHFFSYAPRRLALLNLLALLSGGLASVGVLMLVPLAQLAGIDFSAYVAGSNSILAKLAIFMADIGIGKSLETVLLAYMALSLLLAVLSYCRTLLGATLQQKYVRDMRSKLYQVILESDWQFLSNKRKSEYLHRVGAQVQTMNVSAYQLIGMMHQLIVMGCYLVLMLIVHWQFTVATVLVGFVVGLIVLPVRVGVRDAGERQVLGYREIFASLAEHMNNLKMIKVSAREAHFHGAIEELSGQLEIQQVRMARAGAIISFANAAGLAVGFCVLLYVAVVFVQVPLADFLILLVIMSRIMPKIAGLQASVQGIVFSIPAFRDIENTLLEASDSRELELSSMVGAPLNLTQGLALEKVSFQYPGTNKPIFQDLSLSILVNHTVALSGASGVGKTTLADIFVSLLRPMKGRVLIDGEPLKECMLASWRRSIAYVTQDVYLFNNSIKFNLKWMSPNATDAELWRALDQACLASKVRAMPAGLDSYIGDQGVKLSGGERQRLALARALLTQPKLLILDEATSALDTNTETKIHDVIKGLHGKLTVIIIAHRQSTLLLADRIINVEELVVKD